MEIREMPLFLHDMTTELRYDWLPENYALRDTMDFGMASFGLRAVQLIGKNLPWVFSMFMPHMSNFENRYALHNNVIQVMPEWFRSCYHSARLESKRTVELAYNLERDLYDSNPKHGELIELLSKSLKDFSYTTEGRIRSSGIRSWGRYHLIKIAEDQGINAFDCNAMRDNMPMLLSLMPKHTQRQAMLAAHPKMTSMLTVLATANIDIDNPTVVNWYEQDMTRVSVADVKPKSAKIAKFLRRLNSAFDFNIPAAYIEQVATWAGEKLRLPEYKFELLSTGILAVYREAHFGSCMHHSDAPIFYRKQNTAKGLDPKPRIQMLTIRDPGTDHLVGRALVWHDVKDSYGNTVSVLDRVYPSDNGNHILAATKYAQKQGWVYKTEHRIDGALSESGEFSVRVADVGRYPYMDTFAFTDGPDRDGFFWLSNRNTYEYELRSTSDNCPWSTVRCDCCHSSVDESTVQYSDRSSHNVCQRCINNGHYIYCESVDDWVHERDIVEPQNCPGYPVPEDDDELYWSTEHWYHIYTGYIPSNLREHDYVEVTHGQYADEFVLERDAYYHEDDETGDFHVYASERCFNESPAYEAEQDRRAQVTHPTQPQGELF